MFSNTVFNISACPLTSDEYRIILNCAEANKWCTTPPVKPNPGDIILYKNEKKPLDWKSDQYRWRDIGRAKQPKQSPFLKVSFSINNNRFYIPNG